jgi:sulfur-oxidizing protein SoxY
MGLRAALIVGLLVAAPPVAATEDPLRSGVFDLMHAELLGGGPYVFDDRVAVAAPAHAEDNMVVPITVDARALADVEEIVVFADLNPIPLVARFRPEKAAPYLSLRLQLEQGGPIRAAARTASGTWHVGGRFVDAAGGGCTAPAEVHASSGWPAHLGEVWGRAWPEGDGVQRVKVRTYHPMDTGLADGIPAFYVDALRVRGADGEVLAEIRPFEPVSEHPVFTLLVEPPAGSETLRIDGRDTDANTFEGTVPLSWTMSALP